MFHSALSMQMGLSTAMYSPSRNEIYVLCSALTFQKQVQHLDLQRMIFHNTVQ